MMIREPTKELTTIVENYSSELKIKNEQSVVNVDSRWTEFRVTGKNIMGRSQHIAVIHDGW